MAIFYDREETEEKVIIRYKLLRLIFPLIFIGEIIIILLISLAPLGLDNAKIFFGD